MFVKALPLHPDPAQVVFLVKLQERKGSLRTLNSRHVIARLRSPRSRFLSEKGWVEMMGHFRGAIAVVFFLLLHMTQLSLQQKVDKTKRQKEIHIVGQYIQEHYQDSMDEYGTTRTRWPIFSVSQRSATSIGSPMTQARVMYSIFIIMEK